ncbi:MAG: glycoside hydrolase family 36 protein [Rhodoglobus sp.]
MNTEGSAVTQSGFIEIGGRKISFLAAGEIRALGHNEFIALSGSITLLHPFGDTQFYRHGWNSWSPSGWRQLSDAPLRIENSPERLLTADDARNDTPLAHSGSAVGVLEVADGTVLLLGALGLGAPRVGATETTLWGTVEQDSGEWFIAIGPEIEVFKRYTTLLAERLGKRDQRAGNVWCSWYSYYEDISESLINETVAQLQGIPFDVVQLDDGWERSVGDWEANDKFPSGMASTATMISDAGFRPGIWLAPFIALPASQFARERPDLLVQGEDGRPLPTGYNWGGEYYSLDTTQPEVQDHLRSLFQRILGWGFTYLKLDFMYAGAVHGRRSVPVHREQAYRDAVTLIREVVGDEAYLLGCGVPILPSAGLFDGIRVGPDVAAFWDNEERSGDPSGVGAKNALMASLHRVWLRPLHETDPDVTYFRRRRSLLDEDQRQAIQDLATVLHFKSTSDPTSWLLSDEVVELGAWLSAKEHVRQRGRYTFEVDDRLVDFTPFIQGTEAPWSTTVN